MRFDIDWPYMRPALLVLMVISVISVILLTASFSYLSEMEETYSAETGVRNEWREKYNTAKEDKRLIEQYLAAYTQMEQDGIARDEQRLDWVDTLRARVKEMKLPNVRYQIKPQEPFTAAYLETSPNLAVNVSRAKLEMELLHEVDLLSLINDLEMKVPGIFMSTGVNCAAMELSFLIVWRAPIYRRLVNCFGSPFNPRALTSRMPYEQKDDVVFGTRPAKHFYGKLIGTVRGNWQIVQHAGRARQAR